MPRSPLIIQALLFILCTVFLPSPVSAITSTSLSGNLDISTSLILDRTTNPLGFFPNSVAATTQSKAEGIMRFASEKQDTSITFELGGHGILEQQNPWTFTPTITSAKLILYPSPEFELSLGYGMNERGEGIERALYDAIGSKEAYRGVTFTWIPTSNTAIFLSTDVTALGGDSPGQWLDKIGTEAGFSWTPSKIHISGAVSRLQSGLITGGFEFSTDMFHGIWIAETSFETQNPELYPTYDYTTTTRRASFTPLLRLATLYTFSIGEEALSFSSSITYRGSAYDSNELNKLVLIANLEDLEAQGTLADLGKINLMSSLSWDTSSGISANLSGYLNPLDASLLATLTVSYPVGDGDLSLLLLGSGGKEPMDEYRLASSSFMATLSYQVYL